MDQSIAPTEPLKEEVIGSMIEESYQVTRHHSCASQ
jgi:hypothetical protein